MCREFPLLLCFAFHDHSSSMDPDDSTSSLLPLSLSIPCQFPIPVLSSKNLYLHHNIFICTIWDEVFLVGILSDFRELVLCVCIIYMCVCLHVQSCLTLCDPMDCSLPGSSVHGRSRQEYWSTLLFPPSGDLPTPGLNLHLLHWQANSSPLPNNRI